MKAYIALGSNIGNKEKNLETAIENIENAGIKVLKKSKNLKNKAYGKEDQDDFVNAVIEVSTNFSPKYLLKELLLIENKMGRKRTEHWGPRIIDLDLIFYDDLILSSDELKLPHEDLQNRIFVLEPMMELNPEYIHPILKKSISQLYNELLYKNALKWIEKDDKGMRLGLSNVIKLLNLLENPHKKLKCIHIAGTNGKGSVANYISNILEYNGYKVGLFTSPFIENLREEIQINHKFISEDDFIKYVNLIKKAVERLFLEGIEATQFEIIVSLMFLFFASENVDIAVIEVGLGGVLDATNVIENPLASVITNIGLDHIDILGKTLEEIAIQKAGIIKKDSPVFIYPNKIEVMDTIIKVANSKNANIYTFKEEDIKILENNSSGVIFDFKDYKEIKINMLGKFQAINASLALLVIDELSKNNKIKVSKEKIHLGLKSTKILARQEIIFHRPNILLDGSHNVQGIKELIKTIKLFDYNKLILGIGILKDKNYSEIIKLLSEISDVMIITEVNNKRKLDAEILKQEIKNKNVYLIKDIHKAFDKSLELAYKDDLIVWCGSLYLMKDIKKYIKIKDFKR